MYRKPDYKKAMRTAYGLFEELEIHSFPVSVFDILKKLNIPCFSYSQTKVCAPQFAEFVSDLEEITDGLSYKTKDPEKPYIVFYNEEAYAERIPFTLAHELGHILLRHHYKTQPSSFLYPNTTSLKDCRDIEADYFAGALLRPAYLISLLHLNDEDIHEIFQVSHQCANTGIKIAKKQFGFNPRRTHPELALYFDAQFHDFLGQKYCPNCGKHFKGAYLEKCPFCKSSSIIWADKRQLKFIFKDDFISANTYTSNNIKDMLATTSYSLKQ